MEVVRLESWQPRAWPRPAVAVGNFDGVHRGHQALVRAAVADARRSGGTAVALTFDPHPARVLSPERVPESLMTLEQKAEVMGALGVERLAVLPFTAELARETAEQFARLVLHEALGAALVVVGSNFRFGRHRAGDVPTLRRLGQGLAFDVHEVPPLVEGEAAISSTRIREALGRGEVEAAAGLLGRLHFVDGTVVEGEKRGRTLGFPTANLSPVSGLAPRGGVYAGWARPAGGDQWWPVVANLGRRPTFPGAGPTVEAHLLDFGGDLYGRGLRLAFAHRLRDEQAFPGVGALVAQIGEDVAEARRVLEKAPGTGYSPAGGGPEE